LPCPTYYYPVLRRAEELDEFDAILHFDRRDQLAALLTDDDVASLKHLEQQAMGGITLRALALTSALSRPGANVATLPAAMRSLIAPARSSIGTLGSTRC
jgi:hypothetical protein